MYYPPIDYTAEEVKNAALILEQWLPQEKNPDIRDAINKSLAVMRAINKIGKGTEWLSKLSNT